MEEASIKKQVLATIVYYNELDYPHTVFEVWKYLTSISNFQPASPAGGFPISNKEEVTIFKVISFLEGGDLKKWIETKQGFYFLKGRSDLVASRLNRNKIAFLKLGKLRRVVGWLKSVPFVRMVAVTGRLAMKNTESKSDWDLLIALESGRIWTGRTLVTLLLHLMGKRRHASRTKDRACLNHFVSQDGLNLENEKKSLSVALFSSNEYYFSSALFGSVIFSQFQEENRWIEKFHPNFSSAKAMSQWTQEESRIFGWLKKIGEGFLNWDWLERALGYWEKNKIEKNPKTFQVGSFVEANERHLVFLPEPQGEDILEKFMLKIERLISQNKITF